jgi:hypothetical protein
MNQNALKMNTRKRRHFFMNYTEGIVLFVIAGILTLYLIGCIVAETIAESFRYTGKRIDNLSGFS